MGVYCSRCFLVGFLEAKMGPIILVPEKIIPPASGSDFNYQSGLAGLTNDTSVIVWSDWHNTGSTPALAQTMHAQLIDSAGNPIGSQIAVDPGQNFETSPSVAALPDGGFIVTWVHDFSGGSNTDEDIYQRRYDANGNALTGPLVVWGPTGNQFNPQVTSLANDGWLVAYEDANGGASGDVYGNFYNSSGASVAAHVNLGASDTVAGSSPEVTGLNNGNAVVAYTDPANGQNVLFRIYSSSGTLVRSDTQANGVTTGSGGVKVPQDVGSVAALSNGGFAIAYTSEFRNGGTLETNDFDVYVAIFDANGNKVGSDIPVNTAGFMQYDPTINAMPNGTFAVTYSNRAPQSGTFADESTSVYTNSGSFLGQITTINTTGGGSQLFPDATTLADGRYEVTWTDFSATGNIDYSIVQSRPTNHTFNRDGSSDALFRNNSTGDWGWSDIHNNAWHPLGGSSSAYTVAGIGDFNNDGSSDALFRNNSTGDWGWSDIHNNAWHPLGGSSNAYQIVG
jgi:hypothetical protein